MYTIVGSSRLGGFMVFTWMSFWGLVFFIKAAEHAIPGFASRRYALAVFLFPSLIYWGSSIGKEAVVGFCLGLTSWGAALVLTRRGSVQFGVVITMLGLAGAAFVRPKFGAICAGAIVIALVTRGTPRRHRPTRTETPGATEHAAAGGGRRHRLRRHRHDQPQLPAIGRW